MEPQDNVQLDENGNLIVPPQAPAPMPAGMPPPPASASAPMAPAPGPTPPDMLMVPDWNGGGQVAIPREMLGTAPGMAPPPAPEAADTRQFNPQPNLPQIGGGGLKYGTTTTTDTQTSEMGAQGRADLQQGVAGVQNAYNKRANAEMSLNNAQAASAQTMADSLAIDAEQRAAANQAHFDEVKRRQQQID